jgi:hypothetical protein
LAPPELIPNAAPVSAVAGLGAAQDEILNGLWIDTAQQLVGIYGTNEATRTRLAAALGIERTKLDSIVNAAQRQTLRTRSRAGGELEIEAASRDYPLGALLEDPAITLTRMAGLVPYASAVRGALPESHTLLQQLPPLRSQGQRPTCVAHAVLALREQLETAAGAPLELDLSEQYAYWWCKERDGLPGRNGTYLSLGMKCLGQAGAPFESLWPYNPTATDDQGQGPPPPAAARGDPAFCTTETQEFNRADIEGMKACLVEGRSIPFALPVFDSWFKSSAMARWGKITMPLPGEPMREGHAMTIAGYQDDAGAPGGGYFLLRNSWQPWAWDGTWQPGYGYIPYAYVSRHASAIYSARRVAAGRPYLPGEPVEGTPWLIAGSQDIWLRQAPDGGIEPQAAQPGHENALYLRVTNPGPAYLYGVSGEVYFRRTGTGSWERAATLTEPWLPPGETVVGPMPWFPPAYGHFALAARLA